MKYTARLGAHAHKCVHYYSRNYDGVDYVVGDIHGCFDSLERELDRIGFNVRCDRLFSVGDLIDRDSKSHLALDYIARGWFIPVLGNHEEFLLQTAQQGPKSHVATLWRGNGGAWFFDADTGEYAHDIDEWASVLSKLPIIIDVEQEFGKVGIVHAQPHFDDWWDNTKHADKPKFRDSMIWGRERAEYNDHENIIKNVTKVFVGHTPSLHIVQTGNIWYIDTGACFKNGKLTVLPLNYAFSDKRV